MDENVKALKQLMENSSKTIAVTGSGISYLYGVGRLKKMTNRMNMMRILSPDYVKKHPEDFYQVMWDAFLEATFKLGPSPVHKQLAELEKRGMLQGIITQNLDCLHQLAGSTNVVEIAGGFDDNICVECGARYNDVNVWNEGHEPRCEKCGGPLMPANFGRGAAGGDTRPQMDAAGDLVCDCQLVIVMGTTGFMSDPSLARLNPQADLVQINPSSTVFDSTARLNIREDAEKVFNVILNG